MHKLLLPILIPLVSSSSSQTGPRDVQGLTGVSDATAGTWERCLDGLGRSEWIPRLRKAQLYTRTPEELMPLVVAIGWVESRWTNGLVSKAGAVGPMQVMPAAARHTDRLYYGDRSRIAKPLSDVNRNLQVGMRYIQLALRECQASRPRIGLGTPVGSLSTYMCVSTMYNGGYRQLDNWNRNKLLVNETANYTLRVLATMEQCSTGRTK
jgi:soluble lytic murein transglycosylase-like protein